jgi:hypothetical protein
MEWTREVFELPDAHGWTARPGNKILVLDRGAVVLEFPGDWFVSPGATQVNIRDRASAEESTSVLAVSSFATPPADWSGLPLRGLLATVADLEEREYIGIGSTIELRRGNLEMAWTEHRFVDEREHREARSRICLARAEGIHCLITLDSWPEDEPRLAPVWESVLASVRLGAAVDDPARGRRIE